MRSGSHHRRHERAGRAPRETARDPRFAPEFAGPVCFGVRDTPSSSDRVDHIPLRRSELLGIFAFWTFLALLTAANGLLDPRSRGVQPLVTGAPITLAFIESYLWAALTPFLFWLTSRFSIERENRVTRVLLFVVAGVVVAIV